MLQNVTATPSRRSLEFGIYRDGDNNLDAIQESTLSQALRTSRTDSRIEFTVEDTTRLRADGDASSPGRCTPSSTRSPTATLRACTSRRPTR